MPINTEASLSAQLSSYLQPHTHLNIVKKARKLTLIRNVSLFSQYESENLGGMFFLPSGQITGV